MLRLTILSAANDLLFGKAGEGKTWEFSLNLPYAQVRGILYFFQKPMGPFPSSNGTTDLPRDQKGP